MQIVTIHQPLTGRGDVMAAYPAFDTVDVRTFLFIDVALRKSQLVHWTSALIQRDAHWIAGIVHRVDTRAGVHQHDLGMMLGSS